MDIATTRPNQPSGPNSSTLVYFLVLQMFNRVTGSLIPFFHKKFGHLAFQCLAWMALDAILNGGFVLS